MSNFGIDNWTEIARYMGTRTSRECEVHYYSFYYKSAEDKVPSIESVITERNKEEILVNDSNKDKPALSIVQECMGKTKLLQAPEEDKVNYIKEIIKIDGFMPLRGDFNIEYDNDAELLLADMEFFDDDTEAEKKLKDDILKLYNKKLDDRIIRKKFVIENELLDAKKQSQKERTRTKEEREVYSQMRCFMRFCKGNEFEELVEGLLEEKKLKQRLEEIKILRSLGLTTFEQAAKYLDKKHEGAEFSANHFIKRAISKSNAHNRVSRTKESQITSAERYAELNEEEKKLCLTISLRPEHYLNLKEKLIAKNEKEKLVKSMVLDLVDKNLIDKEITKDKLFVIYDFMIFHKLIKN